MVSTPSSVLLTEEELPRKWYNILPDLPEPLPPPRDDAAGQPRMKRLERVLVKECLRQEQSTQRWIDIPEEVRDLYLKAGRPRPLFRAKQLEARLDTPARLYYKAEFL